MNLRNYLMIATVLLLAASCSVTHLARDRVFLFENDKRQKKLVFELPKGKNEENFRVGNNDAKEQFYYFDDGSVFYVARHTTWQTVNKHRIDNLPDDKRSAYAGKDADGLYWKEIAFEDFRIGYAYVTGTRLEEFNRSLNSVKIR